MPIYQAQKIGGVLLLKGNVLSYICALFEEMMLIEV